MMVDHKPTPENAEANRDAEDVERAADRLREQMEHAAREFLCQSSMVPAHVMLVSHQRADTISDHFDVSGVARVASSDTVVANALLRACRIARQARRQR